MQLSGMSQTHLGSDSRYQKSPKNSLYTAETFNCASAFMYEHITVSSFVFLITDFVGCYASRALLLIICLAIFVYNFCPYCRIGNGIFIFLKGHAYRYNG